MNIMTVLWDTRTRLSNWPLMLVNRIANYLVSNVGSAVSLYSLPISLPSGRGQTQPVPDLLSVTTKPTWQSPYTTDLSPLRAGTNRKTQSLFITGWTRWVICHRRSIDHENATWWRKFWRRLVLRQQDPGTTELNWVVVQERDENKRLLL